MSAIKLAVDVQEHVLELVEVLLDLEVMSLYPPPTRLKDVEQVVASELMWYPTRDVQCVIAHSSTRMLCFTAGLSEGTTSIREASVFFINSYHSTMWGN